MKPAAVTLPGPAVLVIHYYIYIYPVYWHGLSVWEHLIKQRQQLKLLLWLKRNRGGGGGGGSVILGKSRQNDAEPSERRPSNLTYPGPGGSAKSARHQVSIYWLTVFLIKWKFHWMKQTTAKNDSPPSQLEISSPRLYFSASACGTDVR